MKKILLTFVLLVGIVAGLFAQKLTYQAVIRDNNQQLVVNTAVKATVTITFTSGAPYQAEFNGSTNLHGLLSIEFGDESLVGRDWTGATIAVKVVNSATSSIVYVNDEPRPVSAVPYALSVNGVAIQQYLTEHKYVTKMQVGNQIHDSISNVVGKAHTHDNMTVLNATTAPYTDADSTKLKGIEAGAEVNVQSDWKQTDGSKDDYIKNKPSITDTVNNILSTGGYVTADALDSRHYLRSDSTVITTMQGNITANATNITSLQSGLSAATVKEKTDSTTLAGRIDALEGAAMDCNKVKECIKDTLSKYTVTDQLCNVVNNCDLSANASLNTLLNAINAKMDSIAHLVDSLAKLPHGGGEVADGQPCPGAPTVSDGTNTYNTVKIGNQCWMKENLRTKTSAYGNVWTNPDVDSTIYGRYYDWAAVMQGKSTTNYPVSGDKVRGICPEGWHVPSDTEWTQLTTYVNSVANYKCNNDDNNIANALSSPTGWKSPSSCGAGHNSTTLNKTGFSAVPAGSYMDVRFRAFGGGAYFWSATQDGGSRAWSRSLSSNASGVSRYNDNKGIGFSVRCLRDAGTGGGGTTPVPVEVSCEQVMECMGDTLGKLNTKIVDLNATVTTQGQKLDSLAHVVDSLAKLPHGGDTVKFTCGTDKVKDADGNEYNTVKIGNQCWMAKNLRTTTGLTENTDYWHADNQSDKDETYGLLYNWAAVMQGALSSETAPSGVQGICPDGWHVPSNAEWDTLTKYVYNSADPDYKCSGCSSSGWEQSTRCIAKALSSTTGWSSNTSEGCYAGNKGDKSNATGFTAVSAGYRTGNLIDFGDDAVFWSATQAGDNIACYLNLYKYNSFVLSNTGSKDNGYSVRCLRDAGTGGGGTTPVPVEVSCEQVMECMGDTLGKLNTKIENLKNTVDSLAALIPGGDTVKFTCGTSKVKDFDNNEYNTVKIGSQCWMKENLRTKTHTYGNVWTNPDVDSTIYGRYYDWAAVMQGKSTTNYPVSGDKVRGICPEGWHVPSDAEWDTLTTYVKLQSEYVCEGCSGTDDEDYTYCIAKALSQPTGWSNTGTGCNAGNTGDKANATGFSAVPAGFCFEGNFDDFGGYAYFWSATQNVDYEAWCRYLRSRDSYVRRSIFTKDIGFSVRCLRDAGPGGGGTTPVPVEVSCEQVMECMGDTLGKLNTKIENLKNTVDSLAALIPGGDTVKFTCGTSKVKDVDLNEYNTVKIGNQCWMKENLRTTKYADGAGIGDEEMFNPDDNEAYVATYGKLYTWSAATRDSSTTYPAYGQAKVQGICPAGWHVPSYVEWDTLTDYVKSKDEYKCSDGADNIAKALASKTGWYDSEESTCAVGNDQSSNNATGFNAVPAGDHYGNFVIGSYAGFWLATKSVSFSAFYCGLLYSGATVDRRYYSMDNGFSVRCLKD